MLAGSEAAVLSISKRNSLYMDAAQFIYILWRWSNRSDVHPSSILYSTQLSPSQYNPICLPYDSDSYCCRDTTHKLASYIGFRRIFFSSSNT